MSTPTLGMSVLFVGPWRLRKFNFTGYGLGILVVGVLAAAMTPAARGQEGATPPHWIWYPTGTDLKETPAETRYFRKSFAVKETSRLALEVTADHAFTLYLDGRRSHPAKIGTKPMRSRSSCRSARTSWRRVASNEAPGPAGFLVRGGVLPLGQGVPIHTNSSWKTAATVPAGDALDPGRIRRFEVGPGRRPGRGGHRAPGDTLANSQDAARRFRVPEGFQVATAAAPRRDGLRGRLHVRS